MRRRWFLNPEFVINSRWGVQPQILGLKFLLDGGLLPPPSGRLSILIQGRPGTGKTSLALQLAASIASQRGCALYLCAEEHLELLVERLSFAGYAYADEAGRVLARDKQTFALVLSDFVAPDSAEGVRKTWEGAERGSLLLVALPNRNAFARQKNPLLDNLRRLFDDLPDGMRSCYVLDSIDAVVHNGGRRFYEDLFQATHRNIGIFISEERQESQQADERLVRGHLADMVIQLGHRTTKTGELQRVFQIQKSRSQYHIQGQHVFSIQSGQGVAIYPSVHALLAVWKRQIRRARTSEPESWAVEDLDFNQVLQDDVARGSHMLLSGRPATHKFALGLTFLASGLAAPNTQALLISLQEDESTIIDIIETYPQLRGLLRPKQRLLNPRLRVLHRPPDYFTAERFIDWIRQNLTDMKRRPMAACRVLFHSLDYLRYNSPLFEEEPLFLAAVLELFRKERMTALFVDVQQQPEHAIPKGFDTTIITDHGPTSGLTYDPDTVRLRVGSTPRCDAYRDERWIRRRQEGHKGYLEFVDPPADAPATPIPNV